MERMWFVTSVLRVTQDPGVRGTLWLSNPQFHKAESTILKVQQKVRIFFLNIYKSIMLVDAWQLSRPCRYDVINQCVYIMCSGGHLKSIALSVVVVSRCIADIA